MKKVMEAQDIRSSSRKKPKREMSGATMAPTKNINRREGASARAGVLGIGGTPTGGLGVIAGGAGDAGTAAVSGATAVDVPGI